MPIIEHSAVRMPAVVDYRRERFLVSAADGATSLTIKEVELHPGWDGRLHTHPIDVAVMVMAGALQIVLDDETTTVRAGTTILVAPDIPHKLVNQLWVPVRMLVTYPSTNLESHFLE